MDTKKNIYILVVVIALIGIGVYFFTSKKPDSNIPTPNNPNPTPTPSVVLSKVFYKNIQYGFVMNLPDSWEGFTTIEDEWEGNSINQNGEVQSGTEKGLLVSIRHPDWEYKSPRQDIPIMVFTLKQWTDLQADKYHIGAAPINPSEIGRNKKYVFAVPARYNYAFLTGYEEVDQIIRGDNFSTF